MFGFKVLLPFFSTIKIHLPQDVADLITHHGTGIGVTVHAQGSGGVDKLFFEPSTVQPSYLPIDGRSHLQNIFLMARQFKESGPRARFLVIVPLVRCQGRRSRCGITFFINDPHGHCQVFVDGRKDALVLIMSIDANFVHTERDGLFVRILFGVSPTSGYTRSCPYPQFVQFRSRVLNSVWYATE